MTAAKMSELLAMLTPDEIRDPPLSG